MQLQLIVSGAIHVSPSGSDSGDGSEAAPFKTLEKARDKVRAILASGKQTADIVVYIHGGTYYLDQTLYLKIRIQVKTAIKSSIKPIREKHPIISGGREITGWESVGNGVYQSAGRQIWSSASCM